MKIADRIRYYRSLLRLSQDFVSKRLSVSRPSYTKMENGSSEFSASQLGVLANLFNVQVETFFQPLSTEYLNSMPLHNAKFRLTKEDFRVEDATVVDTVMQSANELFLWAADEENKAELRARHEKAKHTHGKFHTVDDAIQYTQTLISNHMVGDAIDIISLAMQEFGLWISWNSFGPFSGIYIESGTEIAKGQSLPLPFVAIHSGHPSERQRFSIAHELGHHLLGHTGKIGSPTKPNTDTDEKEANYFAAELLMERSRVVKILKEMQSFYAQSLDFPSIVLLSANHLQVSYSALSRRLIKLGVIPFEEIDAILSAKVRELEQKVSKKQRPQPFQIHIVKKSEELLKKTRFYQYDKKIGGPTRPEDIRFLQDYCYVEYLHSCKSKPPHDSGVIFREVVEYVVDSYPNYLAAT